MSSRTAGAIAVLLVLLPMARAQEMAHEPGLEKGLVFAAPHHGFEFGTGEIARALAQRFEGGWVVATDYRDPARRRWLCVNRPFECLWTGDVKGEETETERARAVYLEYQRRVDGAAGVPEGPIGFLVEIHGSSREDRKGEPLRALETATAGFGPESLRRLKEAWKGSVPIYFDALPEDDSFDVDGRSYRFQWGAGGAKSHGSLRPEETRYALHFELPPPLRQRAVRDETQSVLGDLVAAALDEIGR